MDPCGLGDKIRNLVLDQILKQLLYLVHYNRNIEQLYGRLDILIGQRSALQRRIDEATNNANKIEDNVHQWLLKVDEISKQVDKLHRKCEAKLEGGITSCPNPWLRYKLSKRAEAIAQEADKIYGEGTFVTVAYPGRSQSMLELTNRESNEGIDSRVEIKNHIMEALRNPRFNMIGLCGLGGVGKTTIAKDIEMEEKKEKVFEKVIMATVSQEMNIGQIQDQIIDKLGMQLSERSEEGKASRLYRRLKNEKNMLLILDDLWQELDLGKVGIPIGNVERCSKIIEGCKILLTSRNEELLSKSMKCQKVIKVGVLLKDEAWELFQSIAKLSIVSSSPDLKSIATEIVQKCGGLPLAIATAAKALKDKNMDGWRDYLARLKHPLARNFTGIKEVDSILKLSYEALSRENKDIFLLSAMLSHDPSIEDLLMYSVGLDILKHTQNMGDASNAIFDIVGKLKSLNLFLDSFSSHHFTMHDVVRDVALSIASEELKAVIVWHRRLNEWLDESDLEWCKGICLREGDICDLPEELHGPKLELFLLISKKSNFTIPNTFFNSSKKLKVLAITNVHFSSLPSLSFLQRLKALCLHSCLLEDITEIRSLRKLKVLSLAYSKIERLPGEVAELTSLQMLNLSHCSKLKVIPQKLLSSLQELEVLYMGNSFHQWKVEGPSEANENASLDELKDLPISSLDIQIANVSMVPENLFLKMNLRRYKIFIGKRWIWQGNYRTSKILKLELESSIDLTLWLRNLSKGVEELHLYGSNGQEDVLYNLDASGFPCLRHLQIESNDDIKYIVLNSAHHEDAFPILKSLELKNLKALENLCEGSNDIVFGQLLTLKMKNLPALIGDFKFKDRATNNAPNKIFKSLFNKVLLPKLEILELSNLSSSIALICDDQLPHNSFSNLKTLMVEDCGFVTLMPVHVLKYLNNLEELEVRDCHILEHMFDFEYLNYNEEMASSAVIVALKRLKLWNLPKLKNVCSKNCQGNWHAVIADLYVKDGATNNASNEISKSLFNKVLFPKLETLELSNLNSLIALIWDDQLSHNSFRNLKTLMVCGCGFVTLMPGHVLKYLNNLEELKVQSCYTLEIVFDFEDLKDDKEIESTSVVVPIKKLKLWGLTKLKNVWSNHHQGNVSFPSLRSVHVSYCESLTSIFPASIAKGMLCCLEELEICQCGVDVIVAKDQVLESAAVTFEFPSLTSLHLSCLQELRNFYPHQHTLKLPHLHRLFIGKCDELEIFEKEISSSSEIHEEECTLNSKYPLFSHHDEVTQNLEVLGLWGREAEMIGSGQFPMYHFPNVKLLSLNAEEATTISYRSLLKSFTKLEDLKLSGNFEKAFGGEDVARFPKLTLSINSVMRSLSPSLVSSQNLTHLNVNWCREWTTLMTSSIARSLVHLTRLSVDNCDRMEEIITKQEGEDDVDKEIFFKKLESLELTYLPRLRRFCCHNYTFRFPLLDKLVINKCPKFKEFSPGLIDTPSLKSVQLSRVYWGEHHEIWDTNLSKAIYQQRYVTSRELVLDEDDAIMIKNDKFPTDRCPQVEILGIKGFVDEWVTFPYTLLERFPKLNALHVENCSFEEIFPSHAPSSTSFHNLTMLKVSKCHHLVYLVTCSAVKSLVNLEILEIDECEKLKEIVKNETDEDVERGTTFSNLKTLIVKCCDFMKYVLFHVQKSLNNLEKLKVSNCNKLEMVFGFEDLNDYHKEMESSSVVEPLSLTHLEVNGCHGLTTLMTSSAAASLVHITHLSISNCHQIEEIITKQEREDNEDKEIFFNQMKFMELDNLPRLKRFCGYNYTFRFPLLEHVTITECPRLTMFCPGAIHAPPLQSVRVSKYKPHKDIWMTNLNNTIQLLFTFEEVTSTCRSMALNLKNITMITDVFPNVNTLYVESFMDEGVTFPYSSLERFPQLHNLYVEHCSFGEIFPSQDHIIDFEGKISPFKDLWMLSISGCHQLIHLVTTSTAKSLVSLWWLEINDCKKMEEIVMNDTNEDLDGGITFNKLMNIKLTDIPSLKMFSSQSHTLEFQALQKIEISGCPKMKMFCRGVLKTPKLFKVKIEEHDMKWKDEGDVNKTMEMLSSAKDSFNI